MIDIVAYLVVAFAVGGGFALPGFGAFGAASASRLLGAWEARNQARRGARLAETARRPAHERGDEPAAAPTSSSEVARFGQLALEGADIDKLAREACRDPDAGARRSTSPACSSCSAGGEELLLVAAVGMPEEPSATTKVPTGHRVPVRLRARHGRPPSSSRTGMRRRASSSPQLQADAGMRSAAIVLIKGKGEPYGMHRRRLAGRPAPSAPRTSTSCRRSRTCSRTRSSAARPRSAPATRRSTTRSPGCPNRSLFLDRLEHALAQAERAPGLGRRPLPRPRPVQARQRQPRPRGRRRAAGGGRAAAGAGACARATPSPASAATSSRSSPRTSTIERDAIRVAERIAESLTRPFVLREREHFASASIGISIGVGGEEPGGADPRRRRGPLPRQGARPRRLRDLRRGDALAGDRPHADRERPAAGAAARASSSSTTSRSSRSDDGSIVVVRRRCCAGTTPSAGCSARRAFIPVAEESRLIVPIGRWVIEEACRQAAGLAARSTPTAAPVGVAVNLSARQLHDPELARLHRGRRRAQRHRRPRRSVWS